MTRTITIAALLCAIAPTASAGPVTPLELVSQTFQGNQDTQSDIFTLTFNRPPDFLTVDQYGRPADSFQYWVADHPGTAGEALGNPDRIIRGDEIHIAGDIRIRYPSPPDPDPAAGGWGAIVGEVPFTLTGSTVEFSVPWSILGTSGLPALNLVVTQYGSSVYDTVSIPEPCALVLGSVGSIALVLAGRRKWA
jgi:hypothetical protein